MAGFRRGNLGRLGGAGASGWMSAFKSGGTFRALSNRNYRLLWIGQLGNSGSQWVETIARSWLIWQLTGSPILLATVNVLRAIPMLIFGLFSGVLADRFDKRRILIICNSCTLVNKLVIAVLITTGVVQVWHVLLTAFLMGCSMAFEQPTRTALIPSLVKDDELQNAVALNSGAMDITRVVGPGIAGALIAPLGVGGVYYAAAGVYVVTLVANIMMRVPPVSVGMVRGRMWGGIGDGFSYIYREKAVLALMLLALIPMLFGQPYMTLMPIFADEVLHAGVSGYGWLQSASGFGALLVVLIIASIAQISRTGLFIILGILAFGVLLVLFSQSIWFPLSLVLMMLVGFASTAPRVLVNTELLTRAPPEMYGRVMAVYTLDRGLVPFGTMIVGFLAAATGASETVLIMGSVCILLALVVWLGFPVVRRMQ